MTVPRPQPRGLPEYWSLKGKRILIVEDFTDMRALLRGSMLSFGADEIREAKNGREAIDKMSRETFDIVLCDYNLGKGKDGQQVLEEAKFRNLLPPSSLFIMITAENTSQMVMGAVEYLPDEYLSKPFTKTLLKVRLEKLLVKKESLAPIAQAIRQKRYDKAIALIDKHLEDNARNRLELLRLKGEILFDTGQFDAAAAMYRALTEERDIPWANLGLARFHYERRELDLAQKLLQKLVAGNPSYIAAQDWLAKVLAAQGDNRQAQKVLMEAVAKSPKSILRQRALADVAQRNDDLAVAEKAFAETVKVGKFSCYKHATDYTRLADVVAITRSPDEALKIVRDIRKEFPGDNGARVIGAIAEGTLCQRMNDAQGTDSAIMDAVAVFSAKADDISCDRALQLAQLCFERGKTGEGKELIKYVVRNNHDDEQALVGVRKLLGEHGIDGDDLVATTRQEVIEINNQGVRLTQEGQLKDAIELFSQAAQGMPENVTINLNAAQALIMFLQREGREEQHMADAETYLERVRGMDAQNEKFQKLLLVYRKL